MILLRIDDVGRSPSEPAWGLPDAGLEFFWHWREALGLAGLPVVYGVIPESVDAAGVADLHERLSGGEELAVHGWDHREGAIVSRQSMLRARDLLTRPGKLRCDCYIPPFNIYDASTVADWGSVCPGGHFLGGQYPRDQIYGHLPTRIGNAWHTGAFPALYAHAHELVKRLDVIERWGPTAVPVVLTLHTVWDINHLKEAAEVIATARPFLISPDKLPNYRPAVNSYAGSLTAAEAISVKPIRDLIKPFSRMFAAIPNEALDGLFEFLGCQVVRNCPAEEPCDYAIDFMSRWKHQDIFKIRLQSLVDRLTPGGILFVVAPYSPFETTEDERGLIFSAAQHDEILRTLEPAVEIVDDFPFKSEPAERCPVEDADSIFYAVRRK